MDTETGNRESLQTEELRMPKTKPATLKEMIDGL